MLLSNCWPSVLAEVLLHPLVPSQMVPELLLPAPLCPCPAWFFVAAFWAFDRRSAGWTISVASTGPATISLGYSACHMLSKTLWFCRCECPSWCTGKTNHQSFGKRSAVLHCRDGSPVSVQPWTSLCSLQNFLQLSELATGLSSDCGATQIPPLRKQRAKHQARNFAQTMR